MRATYLYHSFPRRPGSDVLHKGLTVLEEFLARGLLLTPESIAFSEVLTDGRRGKEAQIFQKRACFTELAPAELSEHAKTFGPFALEWEPSSLRRLGAVPVFYVPLVPTNATLEGMGAALLSRLGEIQEVLVRLEKLKQVSLNNPNPAESINVTINGRVVGATACSVQGARDLVSYLEHDCQPLEALTAAIRTFFGFFYPIEDLSYTDALGYYRQHEWRIVANMVRLGKAVTVQPSSEDVERLLHLDKDFFGRELQFPTCLQTRAAQCQYFRAFDERPIHETVRRVVCPREALDRVRSMLAERKIELDVASLDGAT